MDEVRRLREAGVDVTRYCCPHSVFFENVYGSNLDDRRQRVLAKAEPFTIDELMHTSARVYHFGTLLPDDFSLDTIAWLRQRGIVSIDVQGYLRQVVGEDVVPIDWDQSHSLLSQVDVVKLNEMEMQVVTGMTDAHEAARFIASMGVSEVVLTFGSMGSMIYAGGSFYDVPAFARLTR
jgi:sugar/nucleoside kinase (ribokinase family)